MVHLVCCVILFILIIFSIKGPLKRVKWNPWIFYTFFAAGLGIFVISFLHPIGDGYRAFSFIMMFGFPCLYYVWNNRRDYDTLYKMLASGTSIAVILYYLLFIYLASKGALMIAYGYGRVSVTCRDPNMLSMIGMIAVNSAFYMLTVNRNSKAWLALTAVSMGTGCSLTFIGGSRLSTLVIAGSFVIFVIYYIKTSADITEARTKGLRLCRAAIVIAAVATFVLLGNTMLTLNDMVAADNAAQAQISESAEVEEEPVDSQPAEVSPEQAAQETETDDVIERIVDSTNATDADSFLSGRLTLWRNYSQFLNMTGNDFSKADWDALNKDCAPAKHAHNNFFELAFRCGIPVACIHILLELMAGIICLIWLFGRKYREPFYLFCIISMCCYALESMFDIATLPFERPAPFYFYMAMIPVFTFRQPEETEENA